MWRALALAQAKRCALAALVVAYATACIGYVALSLRGMGGGDPAFLVHVPAPDAGYCMSAAERAALLEEMDDLRDRAARQAAHLQRLNDAAIIRASQRAVWEQRCR